MAGNTGTKVNYALPFKLTLSAVGTSIYQTWKCRDLTNINMLSLIAGSTPGSSNNAGCEVYTGDNPGILGNNYRVGVVIRATPDVPGLIPSYLTLNPYAGSVAGGVIIQSHGTSAAHSPFLAFADKAAVNGFVTLQAPDNMSNTTVSYTLPGSLPTTGQVLKATSAGVMSWTSDIIGNAATATSSGASTNIAITDDTSTNAAMYPVWVTANTGNLPAKVSSTKMSFNPSTGMLTTTGVTATFTGNITGNVTGNTSGSSGSCTGNAATVTTNANLTGPVTSTGNATVIANGAISNAMLANSAVANLSGTNTGDQTISDATISITDITTNNASTSAHGFVKKLPNNAAVYYDGTGNYSTPAGSGGTTSFTRNFLTMGC